jgi:hypothetical protein
MCVRGAYAGVLVMCVAAVLVEAMVMCVVGTATNDKTKATSGVYLRQARIARLPGNRDVTDSQGELILPKVIDASLGIAEMSSQVASGSTAVG